MALAVLHVTSEYPPLQFGGLGTAVEGLVEASAMAGIEVAVLVVRGGAAYGYGHGPPPAYGYAYGGYRAGSQGGQDGLARSRPPDGVSVFEAPFELAFEEAIPLAAECQAHVVHLHSSWLWPVARTIRDATGAPIVYTAHSLDRAELAEGEWVSHGPIQDVAIREADRVVALSRSERERLRRFYPGTASRVRVVGNGITSAVSAPFVPRRHRAPATSTVLYVGRFVIRKGITDLFEAIPLVLERVPHTCFVVAGGESPESPPGYCASWLPPRVWGSRDRIEFLGWQRRDSSPGLPGWYATSDILVVPSRYEPFGMVILEGMLFGLPIVAAAAGGPAEILEHGRTGLLFPPGDVEALAGALVRLLEDRELRQRLGTAARQEVRARWGWDRILPKMVGVYREARDGITAVR